MLIKKIKSSTLLEAVISLTILMVIFSIAITLIININKYTTGNYKLEMEREINALYNKTLKNKSFYNEVIRNDDNIIEKEVKPYRYQENSLQVKISVYDLNYKEIASEQRIIKYE